MSVAPNTCNALFNHTKNGLIMHINFSEVLSAKYFEKYITVKCIISGKSEIPYSVPKKVKIKCPKKDKYCKGDSCTFNNDADSIIEISHKHIL